MRVVFPDGTRVTASALRTKPDPSVQHEYGLYLDPAWDPPWPADWIDWPDYGVPSDASSAVTLIEAAFERAQRGVHVEIGCIGGLGRTGTVLACMAVLSGVPAAEAVCWVRTHYDPRAIETEAQAQWIAWFAANRSS